MSTVGKYALRVSQRGLSTGKAPEEHRNLHIRQTADGRQRGTWLVSDNGWETGLAETGIRAVPVRPGPLCGVEDGREH